jgi:SAM-dependent methyltransferase
MAPAVRDRVQDLLSRRGRARGFERRWGFAPPPEWSDRVGYETLLEEIESHRLDRIEGDVLEIGPLLGGGTVKLCGWFGRSAPEKRVIVVDVFDPAFDQTITAAGWTMEELYANWVGDRDQRAVFDDVTKGCTNLVTIAGDSATVEIPAERLAFAFVDGNHSPDYVRSDFELVWRRLTPGGIVAFHDYGGDLPGVTSTLHACIGAHADEIARVWTRSPELLLVERR